MWKIEKIISKGDYNYCIIREHPFRTKNGYVLHHRAIVENHLGRLLSPDEVVHHKNGVKKDNRIENLEVLSASEHTRLHATQGRKMVRLKCPVCSITCIKEYRQTHLGKKNRDCTCCSKRCGAILGRMKRLGRVTAEMEKAITGNILLIYNSEDNPVQTVDNGMRRDYTPSA